MIGQFCQTECVYASAITRGSQAGVWAEAVAKALSDSSFYAPFPPWNIRFGKNSVYWRKATSRYTVGMKIDGLPASADGTPRPGPPGNGPWITVSAGREEGDSEEP
jgi:hypothetical protein